MVKPPVADAARGRGERGRRLTLIPLVAATYFMVSGGPYGLEELIAGTGYGGAALVLVLAPLLWSLPTALMIGELGSALPEEGGYYVWVKRALGPFWGFQEAWLSLVASVFDMAIYPTLFVLYLGRLWPALGHGHLALAAGGAMIAACALWNIAGAGAVGRGSVALTVVLLAPFAVLVAYALAAAPLAAHAVTGSNTAAGAAIAGGAAAGLVTNGATGNPSLVAPLAYGGVGSGLLVAMWNYMGWDNASTIAGEVERPQRNYPLGMLAAVTLVAVTYLVPVCAIARTGIDPRSLTTGSWVDIGARLGGPWLGRALVVGGVLCGIGMFNALVLSYSRLPAALARDGFLPRALLRTRAGSDAPWVSILACCLAYALCLELGFVRLVTFDILLYGLALVLEFVSLVVLRVREPGLVKPFRVPGGTAGAVAVGVPPTLLVMAALWGARGERVGPLPALVVGAMLVLSGALVYWIGIIRRRRCPAW